MGIEVVGFVLVLVFWKILMFVFRRIGVSIGKVELGLVKFKVEVFFLVEVRVCF